MHYYINPPLLPSLIYASRLDVADLAVKASHRRRGVGSSLMRWAIEYAESKDGMIYLEATPAGAPLYEKLSFEAIEKFGIDLEPYGGHGIYEEVAMLWQPKGPVRV